MTMCDHSDIRLLQKSKLIMTFSANNKCLNNIVPSGVSEVC